MKNIILNNKLLSISLFLYLFLSVEMLLWFDESMSRNRDWAYLAATTFQFIDEKWTFPNWVYAPWYYMICSYTFGPILFLFYKLDYISLRTAGTLTYQYANVLIHLIGLIGVIKFCKLIFFNREQTNLLAALFLLFPFFTKHLYQPCVEVLVLSSFPWIFYYLLKIKKKNKKILLNYLKLSLIFGLAASSKISVLVPLFIFLFIFLFNYDLKNFFVTKKFWLSILLPTISVFIFLLISKLIIGNWIWDNTDAGNAVRGYGGIPPWNIFYNFDFFEAWKADLRQADPKNSMLNFWIIDFFADQSQMSFAKPELNHPENYIIFKFRLGILITSVFFLYYLSNLFFFFKYELNKFNYKNNFFYFRLFFVLSFFLIVPETIAYTFAVYSKGGGNFDLRYWTLYCFPLTYLIILNLGRIENFKLKKYNVYFLYIILFLSFFQRSNLLSDYF